MDKKTAVKRAESLVEAMKVFIEKYDLIRDENCPLEGINANEEFLSKMWNEFSEEEMKTIVKLVGIDW